MSAESEFVKAMMDGSIQRAIQDALFSTRNMCQAWHEVISSAARILRAHRERRERAEAARRVHEWEGLWLWD